MFFCQISRISILCLDQRWIFPFVNLVICSSLMTAGHSLGPSMFSASYGNKHYNMISTQHGSYYIDVSFISSSSLFFCHFIFFLFVFLIVVTSLLWALSSTNSSMNNINFFCFSWEARGKREGKISKVVLMGFLFSTWDTRTPLFLNIRSNNTLIWGIHI